MYIYIYTYGKLLDQYVSKYHIFIWIGVFIHDNPDSQLFWFENLRNLRVFPAFSSLLSSGSLAPPAAHGNRRKVLYGAGHLWGLSDAPCESWGERGSQQGDHFRRNFWGKLCFFWSETKGIEMNWDHRNWITGKIEMFWMDVLNGY